MVNQIHAKKLQNIMHFELILMFLLVFMTLLPSIAEFCHNVKQFTSAWLLPCMSWFGIIQGYCQISANSRPTASNLASIWQYPWIIPNHDIAAIIMPVNYYFLRRGCLNNNICTKFSWEFRIQKPHIIWSTTIN